MVDRSMLIQPLQPTERGEAVAVLAAAFHDYPVMRYVLQSEGEDYAGQLEALVGYYCDRRFLRGWPVLGVRVGGSGVAIASLNEPSEREPPSALERAERRLQSSIGEAAYSRMLAFEAASDGGEPAEPHYFLGMLGVHPEHRGRGYAGALLEHIRELSRRHPLSRSVALSTEDRSNLPLYEKFGFERVAEARVGELRTWSLVLPTP